MNALMKKIAGVLAGFIILSFFVFLTETRVSAFTGRMPQNLKRTVEGGSPGGSSGAVSEPLPQPPQTVPTKVDQTPLPNQPQEPLKATPGPAAPIEISRNSWIILSAFFLLLAAAVAVYLSYQGSSRNS